ncbi:MAG: preprotein translocase subunit SecA [Eubacteriales bacterium]
MKIIDKIIGTYSDRQIKKLMRDVNAVEDLAAKYGAMTDSELRETTPRLREKLANGASLDDILADAFAVTREAAARVLDKRPFKVQVMGGIILHHGRIAEMKTGEGKTLVATMPAYLNALTGEGVHIITVNEYLAHFQGDEMGRVYNFLGLSTGLIGREQKKKEKQAAYNCDITYGTNNEFGFDYLRDNMVVYKDMMVQRGHIYCIVDEVDSILIDEARTPLIISGEGEKSTDLYDRTETFVRTLKEFRIKELDDKEINDDVDADFIVDEKARTTVLTASGVSKAERFFSISNLSDAENSEISHHINQAVRARGIMHLDVDYVVKDGQVLIVDSFTGRLMPGRRYSDGLHQAIEAKEHVKIEKENKTLATITFQNYFRMYKKLSGMTGTALTEENEFREIYNLDVVSIPTNMPMIREDHPDVVYKNQKGKYNAIVDQIITCHEKGQPVLVGTVSIDKSEALSKRLKLEGVEHTVLNAKQHEREAEIIAQAGRVGTVTIATNMAGRGTDIILGGNPEFMAKKEMRRLEYDERIIGFAVGSAVTDDEELLKARAVYKDLFQKYKKEIAPLARQVCEAGGLFIIGTERHESRRIDNQLRGRSGRQGDPGESRFFLSLDDDLMRLFGSDRIIGMVDRLGLEDDQPIEAKILSNTIEKAQKQIEDQNFTRRKNVLNFDDVMNQQRTVVYNQRREVLDGVDVMDKVTSMIHQTIVLAVESFTSGENQAEWNFDGLRSYFYGLLCGDSDFKYSQEELAVLTQDALIKELEDRAMKVYASKEKLFPEGQMREIERALLLRNVDLKWMDHLDAMDDLRDSIGLQAYAQRNPISEYRLQGADMFEEMINAIREDTVRNILAVMPRRDEIKRAEVAKVTGEGFSGSEAKKPVKNKTIKNGAKVGRNDPCPCGSGKKYKKCCGLGENEAE